VTSIAAESAPPIDAVFSWVDDSFPDYRATLERHATSAWDRSRNRTRDNLDLLKYSLRSLATYAPWIRHVYLVTCAPQIPRWLAPAAKRLTVVHHDRLFEPASLPTFNSFAIVSTIPRIPGLSERFLYIEDDMLFGRAVAPSDFIDAEGRIRIFRRLGYTASGEKRHSETLSPWNAALAQSNHLLDQAFGRHRRRTVTHVPLLIDRPSWAEMEARWPDEFARTRASRFRARYNVVPEYLYPHFLHYTGRGRIAPTARTYRDTYYHGLENLTAWAWCGLHVIALLRPKMIALNDGFGDRPNERVVRLARRFLERRYPVKSPYEA